MKKKSNLFCQLCIFILLMQLFQGCKPGNVVKDEKTDKIISLSILPQEYFTQAIAGNNYSINILIPPGASPAGYEPTPRQIHGLSNSGVYLTIGEILFEKNWLPAIKNANPDLLIENVSKNLEFITPLSHHDDHDHSHSAHAHSGADPHIWLSVKNAPVLAQNTFHALKKSFPKDSAVFKKTFQNLKLEILAVDSAYESKKEELNGQDFLIYHPALGYLAKEYNMTQHVLEFEGKEPPPSHVKQIIETIKNENIEFIFVQKQFNMDNAKSLATETGIRIIQIDPLDENWKKQMLNILSFLTSDQPEK